MPTIQKTQRLAGSFKERVIVKAFKTSDAMHAFLNGQDSNNWKESTFTKAGTYAFAGGQYHNVKTLDASILNHI